MQARTALEAIEAMGFSVNLDELARDERNTARIMESWVRMRAALVKAEEALTIQGAYRAPEQRTILSARDGTREALYFITEGAQS